MVLGVIGSVLPLGGTGWYFVVLGQYNLVLLGIKWYCVKVSGFYACIYFKKWRFGRVLQQEQQKKSVQFFSRHFATKIKKS